MDAYDFLVEYRSGIASCMYRFTNAPNDWPQDCSIRWYRKSLDPCHA
jgi:hypothetical protein